MISTMQKSGEMLTDRLKIVTHEPESWFLLAEGNDYFLEVGCQIGEIKFSLLVKLTKKEIDIYEFSGEEYIQDLANEIQRWPQAYYGRNQPIELQKSVGLILSALAKESQRHSTSDETLAAEN